MSSIDFNFIDTSKIQIVTIKVTEQINPHFLQEFLKTNLESNNILINNTTFIWHSFIEETNLYEVYVINDVHHTIDIYPNIVNQFYNNTNDKNTIDLFIVDNFFAVYKNSKLYFFKYIKNSSIKDIQNYIEQTYKLTLDNIVDYNSNKFNQLLSAYKNSKNNTKKVQFIKLKKDNLFSYFFIFFLISIVIFISISFTTYSNSINSINTKLLKLQIQYKKLQHNKISYIKITPKLIELFKYIKIENLISKSIVYEKYKIKLDLFHQDKTKLLNFLTIYNGNISIKNIEFVNDIQLYKMVVYIEI